eukprot:4303893-Pyramimonas_sp.AAC.1
MLLSSWRPSVSPTRAGRMYLCHRVAAPRPAAKPCRSEDTSLHRRPFSAAGLQWGVGFRGRPKGGRAGPQGPRGGRVRERGNAAAVAEDC